MPTLIVRPTRVPSGGNVPMVIDEYVGRASTGEAGVSIALLRSPAGFVEPAQRPDSAS
jgi:hypothetical protein